ncbi:carotenoid oxygenase family protein [Streptomyces sp. DSM 41014]|uniref:Dioxygenase n=1 Tax=Streptomyces hintoniae TaxID=3075521 RepID=A0ABU2UH41_9ACTN|nr:carotenoid oxygenase family protein [Streptomyces sp. DSM 41014]MDT0472529.1 carotenoid oxygenase family protein [Streptomyces sp. DSM 41014]
MEGAFAPVTAELTAYDLPVTGRIPVRGAPMTHDFATDDGDPRHGRVRQRTLDDRPQEFPQANGSLVARRHRYGYAVGEDDGYAPAYAHDPDRGAADPLILADQDFTGEPVARVHLPGRRPLGFHGNRIPDA